METNEILTTLFLLIGLIPVLGGGVGAFISVIVDLVKSVLLFLNKITNGAIKPLGDHWGGYLFAIFNFVAFVGLAIFLGGNPAEIPLPDVLGQNLEVITGIVTAIVFLIGQFVGGTKVHELSRSVAPALVSTSYRLLNTSD